MADSQETSKDIQSMTIVPSCIPPLKAGTYAIRAEQTVNVPDKANQAAPDFSKDLSFSVSAPRFSLPPTDVYSVYPPANAEGPYSDTLPHIVLSRRTLPWERALTGGRNGADIPWLALLLLDEDDLLLGRKNPREVQSRALKEIPRLLKDKDPWDKDDNPCQTLDIPLELFQDIAPAWEDLPYLAHVRRVGTQNMESEGIEDQGWFSVIIGNRLPSANKENRVYLVSLEGLEPYLPGKNPSPLRESPPKSIRLVVLSAWRFIDQTEGKGFDELVQGLEPGPMKMQPAENEKNAANDRLYPEAAAALDLGYAPISHTTRQGFQTMSWYRGPLVPLFLPTDPRNIVYSSADAALRYDPHTGLMDVSYAAAWQLGRLLGLQNKLFVHALYKFKLMRTQRAAAVMVQNSVQERFGLPVNESLEEMVIKFLGGFDPSESQKSAGPTKSETKPSDEDTDHYQQLQNELKRNDVPLDIPKDIQEWLARLFLLQGVPLNYLVPHPQILKKDTLRFFYMDTTWVGALLDGALSIGRSPETRLYLDKAMAGNFLATALEELEVEEKSKADLGIDWEGDAEGRKPVIGHLTGFLLRSELVSGWRGMEIVAYDEKKQLKALRMQRLANDIMFCIFNGQVKKVVIIQPPHGMHFGVSKETVNETEHFKKIVEPGGSQSIKKIPLPMRPSHQVIEIYQLAQEMNCQDKAAEFVRRMIKKPVKATISITYQPQKPLTS
jgi:hypothetical protein